MKSYKAIRDLGMLVFAFALLALSGIASAEDAKPSGTLHLKETEVGLLIGGDWGKGCLLYTSPSPRD